MSELGDSGDIKVPLICRLCASPTEDGVEIFSEKGQEICLPEKISKCLPVLIRADDDLPKGMCTLCQGKLEFCRQFFEQIYNTTVKLLSILREEEGPNIRISFEDQMLQFVRNYANPALCAAKTEEEDDELEDYEEEEVEDHDEDEGEQDDEKKSSVENVVKAEPREVCDVELKEDKEQVRHFLDELLDDYSKDVSGSSKRKRGRPRKRGEISYKEENQEEEDDERPRRVKDGFRSLVPPPLKICVECGLKSSSHQENIDHWTKAHPNQTIMYRCDWEACEYSSTIVTEIKKHRRNHQIQANQLQKCDKCEKYYPPKYLATRHILVHQEGKNFKCKVCEKSFKTPENLKVHNRIHGPDDVKYTHCCDLCGRRFTQKANLESHMRVHTGLRPFSCDFCEKSFSQKGNLDEHRRTHTGEKPYVCDICGSRHTRKGELLLHIRCIHTHERPFQCSYCPKNFQRRDLLRKHERIHTDTRPYGCEFCGKTFTARDKMIVHRRLHTGERPYMCNFCGRGFCESGNLKKHLRVHGKDIPSVIRQNNKGRGAERQGLGDLDKAVIQGGGVNIQPTGPGRMLEAEPKEEDEGGNVSYEEQVKVEEEYRRRSTVDDQENRSQTPVYPQTPQLRADTPQTPLTPHTPQAPDFNLVSSAQRAAEQQGYSLVTSHPQLQQLQQQPYPQFVSHPLLHQIQSNWSAMYSHIQHPPQ